MTTRDKAADQAEAKARLGYFIQTFPTDLLAAVLRGDADIAEAVSAEMANRGLDIHGEWVGFDEAATLHFGRTGRTL